MLLGFEGGFELRADVCRDLPKMTIAKERKTARSLKASIDCEMHLANICRSVEYLEMRTCHPTGEGEGEGESEGEGEGEG